MQLHHALPPKQPARQAPVDAAHADRHHRPPANPSGLAGSNCGESAVPAAAGVDAAGQVDRGFEEWPLAESSECMHFTCILHALHGIRQLRQPAAAHESAGVAGFAGNRRPNASLGLSPVMVARGRELSYSHPFNNPEEKTNNITEMASPGHWPKPRSTTGQSFSGGGQAGCEVERFGAGLIAARQGARLASSGRSPASFPAGSHGR